MPVKSVPSVRSEPSAKPNNMLNTPAIDINMFPTLPDLVGKANGIDISIVKSAIEIIVPIEKNIRNKIS